MATLPVNRRDIAAHFGPHLSRATGMRLDPGVEPDRVVKTHCCFCGQQCGIQLRVKGNEVIGFEPWLDFPFNQGKLCPKGIKRYLQGAPAEALPLRAIARVDDIAVGGAFVFAYPEPGDARVLVRLDTQTMVAYAQHCTHLSCPVIPQPAAGRLYCPCHEGSFDLATGRAIAGPPQRPLPRVTLQVRDGVIYATGVEERSI